MYVYMYLRMYIQSDLLSEYTWGPYKFLLTIRSTRVSMMYVYMYLRMYIQSDLLSEYTWGPYKLLLTIRSTIDTLYLRKYRVSMEVLANHID